MTWGGRNVPDEEWAAVWKDLSENQGWRFERVTRAHAGGHWHQDFYIPPGVSRGAPGQRINRDFFDNKAMVLKYVQSGTHVVGQQDQQDSVVLLQPPAAASGAAAASVTSSTTASDDQQTQGESRVHPDWQCLPSPNGPFWWNAVTKARQWEQPMFLFTPHVQVAAKSTVSITNPYKPESSVMVSFPHGCKPGEWYAVPAEPPPRKEDPQQQQRQQHQQQQQQQLLLQQQLAAQQALAQQVAQEQYQQQIELARQQAAEEAARLEEELEYEADDPDSDLANAADVEIYESYVPQKLTIGKPHPDPVVEAACLSTVASPDVTLELQIHRKNHRAATALSALQLEAVTYACQRYELTLQDGARAGFFIGDGAGMGKGREIAGLLAENFLQGRRKSLWVSISSDLKVDAERDLSDCGITEADLKVVPLNKCPYGKLKLDDATVLFTTYSSLVAKKQGGRGKNRSRLSQIVSWLGNDFDGCIVFDECHKSKNLIPTAGGAASRTGLAVVELQEQLPNARVLYCSATGASEPRNMGYMVRLGLWGKGTAYPEGFKEFLSALERRGVGAMELLAIEMKRMGLYVCRTLSYAGSSFSMREEKLTSDQQKIYDAAVGFLQRLRHEVEAASHNASTVAADADEVDEIANELDSESESDEESKSLAGSAVWRYFWGQHQRFFMSLCAAMKVPAVVRAARAALAKNKCAIIGMQSTGEASTKQVLDEIDGDDLDDFISAPTVILERMIEKTVLLPPKPLSLKQEEREERMQELMKQRQAEAAERTAGLGKRERRATYKVSYAEAESDDFSDDSGADDAFSEDEADNDSEDYEAESGGGKNAAKARQNTDEENAKREAAIAAAREAYLQAVAKKTALLEEARKLPLPPNPLDELIDQLGGVTEVAEMTGRSGRFVRIPESKRPAGSDTSASKRLKTDAGATGKKSGPAPPDLNGVRYEKRNADGGSLENANLRERDRFNNAEKFVAIISDAASAGISLHADKRFKNQRRRVHITLELPWSADKAVQQLGRSHRSNQVQPPEYIFCFTEIGGERRVASAVAKRLQSLGALTHGDRRATAGGSVSSLEAYNWDTKQGRDALARLYRCIGGQEKPAVEPPTLAGGVQFLNVARDWLTEVGLEKEAQGGTGKASDQLLKEMGRFLNRILGLTVAQQDAVLEFFTSIYEHKLREDRRDGATDECVLEVCGRHVRRVSDEVVFRCPLSQAATRHVTFEVDRGISWEEAAAALEDATQAGELKGAVDGFYSMDRKGFKHVLLAVECLPAPGEDMSTRLKKKNRTIRVLRPSTGEHTNQADYIMSRYSRIDETKAKDLWETIFDSTATTCMHGKNCKRGVACEAGKRVKSVHLLTESTLPLWATVEQTEALASASQANEAAGPSADSETKGGAVGAVAPGKDDVVVDGGDGDATAAAGGDDDDWAVADAGEGATDAAADEGSDAAADTDSGANKAAADKTPPEKVIGINLPVRHALAVLEAIGKLDGAQW